METPGNSPPEFRDQGKFQRYLWLEWLVPALLCTFLLTQLILSSRQLSLTTDEATHLFAGYRYLTCGDLTVSPEHPPLVRIVTAAPLIPMKIAVNCSPFQGEDVAQAVTALDWLQRKNWPVTLRRARLAVSVFSVGLSLLVWIAARRMFGIATSIIATTLLIFEPNVLANGVLVMTDMAVTSMLLFAVFAFYLWSRDRTFPLLLLTGLATGLTLLAKNSGVVILPILCVLAVGDAFLSRERQGPPGQREWNLVLRNLLAVGAVCVIAIVIIWAGYGMRFAAHPGLPEIGQSMATSSSQRALLFFEEHRLLPQSYLNGLAGTLQIFTLSYQTSAAFIAGNVYTHAPWFSMPLNVAIRSTLASLLLMIAGVIVLAISFRQHRREVLFLLVPAVIYGVVCIHSSINVGIRHLLPMLPFLLILSASGCVELARRTRWLKYLLQSLLVLHAASSLHAFPNYLSYANEMWGGPTQAYKYLPWIDLGQGYIQAKAYLERHPTSACWLLTDWQWDAGMYGVPCQSFGYFLPRRIPPSMNGTVVVSSTLLTSVREEQSQAVAPFKNAVPKAFIGGSALLVYEGNFDTRAAAGMSAWRMADATLRSGRPDLGLGHANDAVALAPNSAFAHVIRCELLANVGVPRAALAECQSALRLVQYDPVKHAEFRELHLVEQTNELMAQIRASYNMANSP